MSPAAPKRPATPHLCCRASAALAVTSRVHKDINHGAAKEKWFNQQRECKKEKKKASWCMAKAHDTPHRNRTMTRQ
jgi:hypothetical protein